MPCPVRCEGRRRASPKGGNRGNVLRRLAVASGYGDLNRKMLWGVSIGGINTTAVTVRREVCGRRDADIYRGGMQEPSWEATVTMGVCASVTE
jgi:hypothetical protein